MLDKEGCRTQLIKQKFPTLAHQQLGWCSCHAPQGAYTYYLPKKLACKKQAEFGVITTHPSHIELERD